jgi:mono/diheme cytochrome c family protein
MRRVAAKCLTVVSVLIGLNASGPAQELESAQTEYLSNCAGCHGGDGKGGGPLASKLKTKPADLTVLAKKNSGVFPVKEIYQSIDGRTATESHGDREMPLWGCRYDDSPIPRRKGYKPKPTESFLNLPCEAIVGNRILAIVTYLSQIQEK